MPLVSGQRVGSYEIVAPLGSGGMGDVYRARDTKLQRDVAIKVLRDAIVADPDRLTRFEREAQVLASLNHPNIAQIYGVEEHAISAPAAHRSGQPPAPALALVMELVEGQTLDTLVRPSGLPLDVALPIARQIAEALEAAHEQGIIHRDLKPSNVKVRSDGTVKVLDFGLAKAVDPTSSGANAHTESTTMASPAMTAQGLILGTAAYMSPEQARGKVVDKRADIWAFGCVLFEMLTGQVLFGGETVSDVLASILAREPNLAALPAATPPALRALIAHCLARDPRRRLRDIGDARLALDDAALGVGALEPGPTPVSTRSLWPTVRIAIVAAIAAAAVTAAAAWFVLRPSSPVVWSGVRLGGPTQAFGVRLSPDGQLLAFLTFVDRLPQLAVMKPDAHSWTVLTHDREHGYITTVSWAPDGSRVYFDRISGQPLGVFWVPPLGGEARPLLDDAFGPEVLPDGSLVVLKLTNQGDEELFHFWPDSGRLEPLPVFMRQTDVAPMLRSFPDGKAFVFYGTSERERSQAARLLVYDLASRTTRELATGGRQPSSSNWAPLDVSPDGRSVYFLSDGGDTELLTEVQRQSGTPRTLLSFPNSAAPVTIDVAGDGSFYLDQLVMPTSVLRVAAAGGAPESTFLFASTRHSQTLPSGDIALEVFTAGKIHLASRSFGGEPRVLVDTAEETMLPATVFAGQVALMMGSGDQARLALASVRDGHILRRYSGQAQTGLSSSPDGKTLYYSFAGAIWAQPVAGGTPVRITEGTDVAADPSGGYLYLKRSHGGVLSVVRFHLADHSVEDLPIPARYHVGMPPLSPAAVDGHGRLLVTVVSNDSFYYQTAILDPATKSFTLIPIAMDGDTATAGWAPDGRVIGEGRQYLMSLWHYEASKALK